MTATSSQIQDIGEKVLASERLTFEDGLRLYETPDIFTLGQLANSVRERLHGRSTFYNVNRHINYSNYCVLRCKFCSFYRPYSKPSGKSSVALPVAGQSSSGRDGGYQLSLDEIIARAVEAEQYGATEVHIVGGLHPALPFDFYLEMCRRLRANCPRLHIKAFTAIEIIHFTRITKPRLSIRDVLRRLHESGLGSLPGGGAEIFDDRVHDEAYQNKVGEAGWFDVHRTAHELGIYTNSTMLYGHVETPAERIRHMIKLREHQDASQADRRASFNCFIPLSFVPERSDLAQLPGPTGLDDLRTLAIARLMLDNISHIKAFWIMQTPKLAQVSLNWGVDDIDGTVVYYDITKLAGDGRTHQELSVGRLHRMIVEAGGTPVERDTLYRRVIRTNGTWRLDE